MGLQEVQLGRASFSSAAHTRQVQLQLLLVVQRPHRCGRADGRAFKLIGRRRQREVVSCAHRPGARAYRRERGWSRSAASHLRECASWPPAERERQERLQRAQVTFSGRECKPPGVARFETDKLRPRVTYKNDCPCPRILPRCKSSGSVVAKPSAAAHLLRRRGAHRVIVFLRRPERLSFVRASMRKYSSKCWRFPNAIFPRSHAI